MKTTILTITILSISLLACNESRGKLTPEEAQALAKEAYIYAFPAVEHNKILWRMLDFYMMQPNDFHPVIHLFGPADTLVKSPNTDTYYSDAICDIRYEPVVISIPEIKGRYFSMQLTDIFTNSPEYISTLAVCNSPGNYLLARSDWKGPVPEGIEKIIRVPATLVFALARTQVLGPGDKIAAEIARQYKAIPLSEFAGTKPPKREALEWPMLPYEARLGDIEGFFRMFNYMLQFQILNEQDKSLMEKYAVIGLGPGKAFEKSAFKPEIWRAMQMGGIEARQEIETRSHAIGKVMNGWDFSPAHAGRWGEDYMTRAAAAWKYMYINTREEILYPLAETDATGRLLNGSTDHYRLTFTKEQLPQVKFFWSLTMYGNNGFLIPNPINRYALNSLNKMQYGADGSLTIYIQKESPGPENEANWLPAPNGPFYIILRMYGPTGDPMAPGPQQIQGVVRITEQA